MPPRRRTADPYQSFVKPTAVPEPQQAPDPAPDQEQKGSDMETQPNLFNDEEVAVNAEPEKTEKKPTAAKKKNAKSLAKKSDFVKETRTKQVGVVVTPSLYERLQMTAMVRNTTMNSIINDLLDSNTMSLDEARKLRRTLDKYAG